MTEEDVLRWANDAVARSGSHRRADSFRDRSLKTGRFLLDLLAAVEPRSVDATLVRPIDYDLVRGAEPEACALNAKYAISCARKMGCAVFCLWEDVVEVRSKLLFTFVAAVMARELQADVE
jgi:plastin-1